MRSGNPPHPCPDEQQGRGGIFFGRDRHRHHQQRRNRFATLQQQSDKSLSVLTNPTSDTTIDDALQRLEHGNDKLDDNMGLFSKQDDGKSDGYTPDASFAADNKQQCSTSCISSLSSGTPMMPSRHPPVAVVSWKSATKSTQNKEMNDIKGIERGERCPEKANIDGNEDEAALVLKDKQQEEIDKLKRLLHIKERIVKEKDARIMELHKQQQQQPLARQRRGTASGETSPETATASVVSLPTTKISNVRMQLRRHSLGANENANAKSGIAPAEHAQEQSGPATFHGSGVGHQRRSFSASIASDGKQHEYHGEKNVVPASTLSLRQQRHSKNTALKIFGKDACDPLLLQRTQLALLRTHDTNQRLELEVNTLKEKLSEAQRKLAEAVPFGALASGDSVSTSYHSSMTATSCGIPSTQSRLRELQCQQVAQLARAREQVKQLSERLHTSNLARMDLSGQVEREHEKVKDLSRRLEESTLLLRQAHFRLKQRQAQICEPTSAAVVNQATSAKDKEDCNRCRTVKFPDSLRLDPPGVSLTGDVGWGWKRTPPRLERRHSERLFGVDTPLSASFPSASFQPHVSQSTERRAGVMSGSSVDLFNTQNEEGSAQLKTNNRSASLQILCTKSVLAEGHDDRQPSTMQAARRDGRQSSTVQWTTVLPVSGSGEVGGARWLDFQGSLQFNFTVLKLIVQMLIVEMFFCSLLEVMQKKDAQH